MGSYIAPIQEDLRTNGYPKFDEIEQEEIVLGPKPVVRRTTRWVFSDKENHTGIILTPNAISLQTTKYNKFEEFTSQLLTALRIVGKVVKVAFSDRIGLRYVNRISPPEGEGISNYLQPGLLGLTGEKLATTNPRLRFEQRGDTPQGKIFIRLFQNKLENGLPPGIELLGLKPHEKHTPSEAIPTILDIDHFSTIQRDFDADSLVADMWKLHDWTDRAFRAAITDFALSKWNKDS